MLFCMGVPVQVEGVRVQVGHCAFPALLHFPKLHQAVAIILNDRNSLSGHESLYNYALNLKNLYESINTKTIKSTYSYTKCEQSVT